MPFDEGAFDKRLRKPGVADLLRRLAEPLAAVAEFSNDGSESAFRRFVETQGCPFGDLIHALRVAVTGKSVGLGMFDALAVLGRESSLNRIHRALTRV
jgi:glutamyl-tRNA synthetase